MHSAYLILFLCFNVWAQTDPKIQLIPNPQSIEDFDHQFKGCPENSECDQVMGIQMQRWKDLISKIRDEEMPEEKKAAFIELFRSKYGLPVEFYTNKKSQQGFKPLLFNSPCKDHNSKQEDEKVLRGISFVRSITADKAVIWRDQTMIEVPTESLFLAQPVKVYSEPPVTYYLPLGDQPLFIKNKDLYVLREEDSSFYMLKVSPNGDWKVEHLDFTRLSEWEEKRQNVACPEDKGLKVPAPFKESFCKTVWDEDLKKALVVRMHQGCST